MAFLMLSLEIRSLPKPEYDLHGGPIAADLAMYGRIIRQERLEFICDLSRLVGLGAS